LRTSAEDKGPEFKLETDPRTPALMVADPVRLRQVLINLTGNATKLTDAGKVCIRVFPTEPSNPRSPVRFEVEDSGIGIEADQVQQLFEMFTQADASTTRRYGGTGLGLAISQQIVELMGGTIGVNSQPGEGSKFWFRLPLPIDHQTVSAVTERTGLAGVRVLVVDDNRINRRIFHEHLTAAGMLCETASSGEEALSALRSARRRDAAFGIAVVDFHMPGMDGEELGRAIGGEPELQDTVLVMLSSAGIRGEAAQFSAAGFSAYLTKPTRLTRLLDVLGAAWDDRGGAGELITQYTLSENRAGRTDERQVERSVRAHVLLAEDNQVNQQVARKLLSKIGCTVDVAANGREAVERFRSSDYDAIFMDCQMPEMDGFEAAAAIRRIEAGSPRTPIIALTAHAMDSDRKKCLEAGCDDYATKPINRAKLIETIHAQWVGAEAVTATAKMSGSNPC